MDSIASSLYDEKYYRSSCGPLPYERNDHWLHFFGSVADEVIRSLKPRKVLDAGCAIGMLVESFWDRGVEAWGIDISEYAIANVRRDMQGFCRVGSVTDPPPPPASSVKFDLVTCIEVLEHLQPEEVRGAIEQLTRTADRILFSSTPSDLVEPTHFCVRPPIFWLQLFAEFGFFPDLLFDASFLAPHAMLLRRQQESPIEEVLNLFAGRLRLRIAIVERETRIGRLNEETALARERLRETDVELNRLVAENQELNRVILETSENTRNLQRENRTISAQVVHFAARQSNLKEKQRSNSASHAVGSLREQLVRANAAIAALEALVGNQQMELAAIKSSPGWGAIVRYRNWLSGLPNRSKAFQWLHDSLAHLAMGRIAPQHRIEPALELTLEPALPSVPPDPYALWLERNAWDAPGADLERDLSRNLRFRPLISVLVPIFKVPVQVVREMAQSVIDQTYDNWELYLLHADAEDREVAALLSAMAQSDPRIKLRTIPENLGIAGNSNHALELVEGEFLALLDHDDVLASNALFENARALNENPDYDFLYSDKDQLSEDNGTRVAPLFKPGWSPEIMFSANYLTHLCVMRTSRVREVGGWRTETDGAQDWDLFFRLIRVGEKVCHIPKVLYHWRRIATSVASRGLAAKPYVTEAQRRCLQDHLRATGFDAEPIYLSSGYWKMDWKPAGLSTVSVICGFQPTHSSDASAYAAKIRGVTRYRDFEIVFAMPPGAFPQTEPGLRVVEVSPDLSPAMRLQAAASSCTSNCLVFLDANVEPLDEEWLKELAGPLSCPEIGIVIPKMMDPTTLNIRHAGICFNRNGELDYIFSNQPEHVCNEFGSGTWYRNWTAASGACFAIRQDLWGRLGGFAAKPDYPRFDIDLCLRMYFESGLRLMYNPFARLAQKGTAGLEEWQSPLDRGVGYIRACFPDGDPNFNPNLRSVAGAIELLDMKAPTEAISPRDHRQENRDMVSFFDFNQEHVLASRAATSKPGTGELKRITWILPEFTVAFYGGVHTILRFADYFLSQHGAHSDFVFFCNAHPAALKERIRLAFPALAAECGVIKIRSQADLLSLPASDCAISTLWTTAYTALLFNNTRRKFYFMQDYEPLFYEAGSVSALAEATYNFGYMGICNTTELQNLYRAHGSPAEYFSPSIDTTVFFAGERTVERRPYRLFCYARPSHPRNCFELLASALRKLKVRFGADLQIVTAGADWDTEAEGLGAVVENLGILGYRETGALYRSCDAGVVMMMTAHPSYLPLELMACGALVVTNMNPSTGWLLRDNENCLLATPGASAFAERIEEGLRNMELRERVTRTALKMVEQQYGNWDGQLEKIYQYMRANC